MDRNVFKVIPGTYHAWITDKGEIEGTIVDTQFLEIRLVDEYLGAWQTKPPMYEILDVADMFRENHSSEVTDLSTAK